LAWDFPVTNEIAPPGGGAMLRPPQLGSRSQNEVSNASVHLLDALDEEF